MSYFLLLPSQCPYQSWWINGSLLNYRTIKKTACLTTTMIGYSPRSFTRRKKYQKIKQVCRYGHLILYSWTRKLKHNIIQFMKGRLFFSVRILLRTSELSSYFFSFSRTDVVKKCHSPNPSLDLSLQYKSIASDTTVSQWDRLGPLTAISNSWFEVSSSVDLLESKWFSYLDTNDSRTLSQLCLTEQTAIA